MAAFQKLLWYFWFLKLSHKYFTSCRMFWLFCNILSEKWLGLQIPNSVCSSVLIWGLVPLRSFGMFEWLLVLLQLFTDLWTLWTSCCLQAESDAGIQFYRIRTTESKNHSVSVEQKCCSLSGPGGSFGYQFLQHICVFSVHKSSQCEDDFLGL